MLTTVMGRRDERRRARQAWQEARQLRTELLAGRCLLPLDAGALPIVLDERCVGYVPALYSEYVVAPPPEPEHAGVTIAAGSPVFVAAVGLLESWTRPKARARGRSGWGGHAATHIAIGERAMWVVMDERNARSRFDYASLNGFTPDLTKTTLELTFHGCAPVRLWGPWIPWASVALATVLYGPGVLRDAEFSPLD